MEFHYTINSTMLGLEKDFFRPSIPSSFAIVRHESQIATSGNFGEDNFGEMMIERTATIVSYLKSHLDNEIMIWSDIDIVFFKDCKEEITELMKDKDLLYQPEHRDGRGANFGFQVIRRSLESLLFYSRVLMLQKSSDDQHDQAWGNEVLLMDDAPRWGLLPRTYASESNQGLDENAVLYHANCTGGDSLRKKREFLQRAISRHSFLNDLSLRKTKN